jgi:hypothetical protein
MLNIFYTSVNFSSPAFPSIHRTMRTAQAERKEIFTEAWANHLWSASSTLKRTESLRENFPEMLATLEIKTLFDAGCGDFEWLGSLTLPEVKILGADIVQPLIERLQHKNSEHKFQVMDILAEPPEQADMWLLRDILCIYPFSDCLTILEKFAESESKYVAITSIDTEQNVEGYVGILRPLSLEKVPFEAPEPIYVIEDGIQWFRKKYLYMFSREQVLEWISEMKHHIQRPTTEIAEAAPQNKEPGTQDRNAHLTSNVRLRDVKLHGHRE